MFIYNLIVLLFFSFQFTTLHSTLHTNLATLQKRLTGLSGKLTKLKSELSNLNKNLKQPTSQPKPTQTPYVHAKQRTHISSPQGFSPKPSTFNHQRTIQITSLPQELPTEQDYEATKLTQLTKLLRQPITFFIGKLIWPTIEPHPNQNKAGSFIAKNLCLDYKDTALKAGRYLLSDEVTFPSGAYRGKVHGIRNQGTVDLGFVSFFPAAWDESTLSQVIAESINHLISISYDTNTSNWKLHCKAMHNSNEINGLDIMIILDAHSEIIQVNPLIKYSDTFTRRDRNTCLLTLQNHRQKIPQTQQPLNIYALDTDKYSSRARSLISYVREKNAYWQRGTIGNAQPKRISLSLFHLINPTLNNDQHGNPKLSGFHHDQYLGALLDDKFYTIDSVTINNNGTYSGKMYIKGTLLSSRSNDNRQAFFPAYWNHKTLIDRLLDVAQQPQSSITQQPNGRFKLKGTIQPEKIPVEMIIDDKTGYIVTAYPNQA